MLSNLGPVGVGLGGGWGLTPLNPPGYCGGGGSSTTLTHLGIVKTTVTHSVHNNGGGGGGMGQGGGGSMGEVSTTFTQPEYSKDHSQRSKWPLVNDREGGEGRGGGHSQSVHRSMTSTWY